MHASRDGARYRQAIAWIRAHGDECKPTDLAKNNVAGVEGKAQAEALMQALEDRGYGHREIRESGNHRKTTWFVARPLKSAPGRVKSEDLPDSTSELKS
jgi:hypothetical protein